VEGIGESAAGRNQRFGRISRREKVDELNVSTQDNGN